MLGRLRVEQIRRLIELEQVAFIFGTSRHGVECGDPALSQR